MSAGTYTPAKWPMCTGPLAYGSAEVTVVLLKFFSIYVLSFLFSDRYAKIHSITEKDKKRTVFLIGCRSCQLFFMSQILVSKSFHSFHRYAIC